MQDAVRVLPWAAAQRPLSRSGVASRLKRSCPGPFQRQVRPSGAASMSNPLRLVSSQAAGMTAWSVVRLPTPGTYFSKPQQTENQDKAAGLFNTEYPDAEVE